jgi:hypothetical protein
VLHGKADCGVSLSLDQGQTWQDCGKFADGLDLTDRVKGRRQYFLRFETGAKNLEKSSLSITTVCQANASILPRLKDGGTKVRFQASQQALVSAGPNVDQAQAHVIDGKFGSPKVALELKTPRGETAVTLYAAAHIQSSNPPDAKVKYQIEASLDGGKNWQPVVKDWQIERRGDEPNDFWSQSFCYGSLKISDGVSSVHVRFRNDGGKNYARCEAHLVYRTATTDGTKVTFSWKDDGGAQQAAHVFTASDKEPAKWTVPTGKDVQTRWVEMTPAVSP